MATPTVVTPSMGIAALPPILDDIPILYEDEDEGDMGESNEHVDADEIVQVCIGAFLRRRVKGCRVFSNMNLYYREGPPHERTGSPPYVSPGERAPSYTIGRDGPAPVTVAEILSKRSAQQHDLGNLIRDTDGRLRSLDATTGERYLRPDEAQGEADARRHAEQRAQAEADAGHLAEERVRALEAELLHQRENQGPRP